MHTVSALVVVALCNSGANITQILKEDIDMLLLYIQVSQIYFKSIWFINIWSIWFINKQ